MASKSLNDGELHYLLADIVIVLQKITGLNRKSQRNDISVTSEGTRYKTLNMTRKYALFSGVLPAMID